MQLETKIEIDIELARDLLICLHATFMGTACIFTRPLPPRTSGSIATAAARPRSCGRMSESRQAATMPASTTKHSRRRTPTDRTLSSCAEGDEVIRIKRLRISTRRNLSMWKPIRDNILQESVVAPVSPAHLLGLERLRQLLHEHRAVLPGDGLDLLNQLRRRRGRRLGS